MSLPRREFLRYAACAGLFALSGRAIAGKARPRVVIVGAGYGGAACARYLKLWEPRVEVTLIEPNPRFISCPMSNTVIAGLNDMEDITFPYDRIQAVVDHFVADSVVAIDPEKHRVSTASGQRFGYDRLVLAAGIELMFDQITGYDAAARKVIKHAWKASPDQTGMLRRQLEAMPEGGVFVMAIPMAPYRCPPAPYERISLVANYLKKAKPRGKIIVLDGNPDIIAKKALFLAAWKKHYGYGTENSLIDYRPGNVAVAIDAAAMKVASEFDDVKGDVINLVPPMRAATLTALIGARTGDNGNWCPVDYRSFESTEVPNVHILGDSILSNLSKAAALANNSGKLCASALAEIFNGRQPDPEPVLTSTCYSASTDHTAFHVATVFRYNPAEKSMEVQTGGGVSREESAKELEYMRGWARNIWADTLGLPADYRFTNRF
ncbi:MAG: flavocytochrome C [Hydrogenophilales bacterium CG17_big_fil_post_rev_8_21_14_2_50_63_12]|nr:MAG: flavocytochrome C [Hydrogenophilales bacterium CG17_big_fil_post_rev_8_21_14_2_50_63_12]PIX95875.1 MAG: flavocytochrome C [Hydrogenophilales bacterium CG_4_10_14_3_um_filter_63_21]PJB03457.1 MAG: flavocytochrome C [Hydrogenophilales bacterium CG_4_9_14_3_um_filter_63_34]